MNKISLLVLLFFLVVSFGQSDEKKPLVSLLVLGNIQDAGSPHIACKKDCCKDLFEKPDLERQRVALGLLDHENKKKYLFEATPDISRQMKRLKEWADFGGEDHKTPDEETPDGIFLTHAHIGHYTGLMYLGKEAMGAKEVPVYSMPGMKAFLENNGPWSQLVSSKNILIKALFNKKEVELTPQIKVIPFQVPHRDEFSETVGYEIVGPNKRALFIPDIDKWEKWETAIIEAISKVDYAFLDGTFYDAEEINYRDISEIPHPFVVESMQKFKDLKSAEKEKIHFIHFNHTNPLIRPESVQSKQVEEAGFNIARRDMVFDL